MNKFAKSLITMVLLSASFAHAELVVVGHPDLKTTTLPKSQLSRIFLGQSEAFPDGSRATPINSTGAQRNAFYQDALNRSPAQMEKYWARLIFTGKGKPPREVKPQDIARAVKDTPGAISYMEKNTVPEELKILTISER